MASWRTSRRKAEPYSTAERKHFRGLNVCSQWKSRVSSLVKRALNMSSCSRQSSVLLAAMRSQLAISLQERQLEALPHSPTVSATPSHSCIISCSICGGFMVQPICLPCGHSVCKACVDKSTSENLMCPKCKRMCPKMIKNSSLASRGDSSSPSSYRRVPTLTLQNAFRKWYPKWVESCRHREEGNQHATQGDFASATVWYTKALQTGVCDFRVLGNRSRSFLALGELDPAQEDAQLACRLHPFWAKGHYRRGAVLEKQGQWREAIAAYLLCLHCGGNDQSVVKTSCQLLDRNLCSAQKPSLGDVIKNGTRENASSPGVPPSISSSTCNPSSPSCGPAVEDSLSSVVDMAVMVLAECVDVGETARVEMKAMVSPAASELVDPADFECVLCTNLLYKPVTTPCGHSFCQSCLSRSFDHSPLCPVCRLVLVESFQQHCQNLGKMGVDETLDNMLQHYFKTAYLERKTQEESGIQRSLVVGTSEVETLPVFVCTMAYPGLSCPLHIFEPRYRLMIRRCMDSGSRRFGMCQPAAAEEGSGTVSFASYGTILHINSVESMEDGRSLISTKGERRFKVLERGMSDGYHTAKITFLFDERVTGQEDIASLRALQQETYAHCKEWLDRVPILSKIMLLQSVTTTLPAIDPVPECCPNGPEWVWWYVHIVPTTPTMKLDFLKCTLLRERLQMLKELLPLPAS